LLVFYGDFRAGNGDFVVIQCGSQDGNGALRPFFVPDRQGATSQNATPRDSDAVSVERRLGDYRSAEVVKSAL
jgi:hypothetical protein